ncbi:MAG: thermonuclease family protein, partial [Cellvibrionaceae bacterium]
MRYINLFFCFYFVSNLVTADSIYGMVSPSEIRSVYDGDTFTVTISGWPPIIGDNIKVRVAGVDTPEMRGECRREIELARRAKKHTVALLRSGHRIELRNMRRGKYFRIVADVFVGTQSLSESLIGAGLG